jgi:hypothetical protein
MEKGRLKQNEVKEEGAKESWRMDLERTFVRLGARLLILCLSFGKTGAPSYWLGLTPVQRLTKGLPTEKAQQVFKSVNLTNPSSSYNLAMAMDKQIQRVTVSSRSLD